MLNELAQVVTALDRLGTPTGSRHPRINTMGKNSELLVVCLAGDGTPASFTVIPGQAFSRGAWISWLKFSGVQSADTAQSASERGCAEAQGCRRCASIAESWRERL
jgi:hypothetical protein